MGRNSIVTAAAFAAVLAPSATATAFEYGVTDGGDPICWGVAAVELELVVAADDDDYRRDYEQALRDAAQQWNAVLPAPVRLSVDAPRAESDEDAAMDPHDGRNSVIWMGDEWDDDLDPVMLAGTVTAHYVGTGEIFDADVAVNSAYYEWTVEPGHGCHTEFDLTSVLTHELGHVLGMSHTDDRDAVMYPTVPPCVSKRALGADDREGIEALYADEVERMAARDAVAGCAVARSTDAVPWAMVLVILALAAWRRRRVRALAAAVVALSLTAAPAAHAGIARAWSIEELAARAATAARGRAIAQHVTVTRGRTYTDTIVELHDRDARRITVRQLGGEYDGIVVTASGSHALTVGAEYILLLRARRDGAVSPLGRALGVFELRTGGDGRALAVRDLRDLALVGDDGMPRVGGLQTIDAAQLVQRIAAARAATVRTNHSEVIR